MNRMLGIAFGLATHALFGVTVWYLFWFLKDGAAEGPAALPWDGLLAFQFGAIHSLMLLPSTRRRLAARFPAELYGCIFCTVTCLSLLLTFACWRASLPVFWSLAAWPRAAIQAAFVASWMALIYSLSLTGLGYQTGWTPFVQWLRGRRAPPREFTPRGAYHFFRHPVYLSFLGLVWFTPRMTLDHAVLTGIWTVYILVGSWLKDRRLTYYLGDAYRAYQARVPGYPLVPFGPLGKVGPGSSPDSSPAAEPCRQRARSRSAGPATPQGALPT